MKTRRVGILSICCLMLFTGQQALGQQAGDFSIFLSNGYSLPVDRDESWDYRNHGYHLGTGSTWIVSHRLVALAEVSYTWNSFDEKLFRVNRSFYHNGVTEEPKLSVNPTQIATGTIDLGFQVFSNYNFYITAGAGYYHAHFATIKRTYHNIHEDKTMKSESARGIKQGLITQGAMMAKYHLTEDIGLNINLRFRVMHSGKEKLGNYRAIKDRSIRDMLLNIMITYRL